MFAEKVEGALDAIVTGKEWNMEEELEDSRLGKNRNTISESRARNFRKRKKTVFVRKKE